MPLVNCIPYFCLPCSASELELITSKVFANVPKMPRRVELMLSLICVNPKISMGRILLVLRRIKISTLQLRQKREVNERLCIEEVGVDLEPLCSCPWTRCRSYH